MRATRLLRLLSRLHPQHTVVEGFELSEDARKLWLDVRPTTRVPRCGGCMRPCSQLYDHRPRHWRHTDLGETQVFLRFDLARVDCPRCGPTTQLVPWAAHAAWHTYDFEDLVAYKAQSTDRTRVQKEMRVSWRTVGQIIQRVVERKMGDPDRQLDGLVRIGVDELSYRKGHSYVTIVVDHDRGAIVWASEGRDAAALDGFFKALGPERAAKLKLATTDLSKAYIKSLRENAPNAEIVFDRFHVQRLAHDALDEVRREIQRELRGTDEGKALKGSRFALHKRDENRTPTDETKLSSVMRTNMPLFRAHLLTQTLATILDLRDPVAAQQSIDEWLAWAARARLKPFVRVARTIREHLDGILGYVRTGLSNGRSEGMNGKVRVLTRRAFGFHSASSLIAMLHLCCAGLHLTPRHV